MNLHKDTICPFSNGNPKGFNYCRESCEWFIHSLYPSKKITDKAQGYCVVHQLAGYLSGEK